jgi:hypothetical protein
LTTLCGAKGIPVSCNGIITSDGCTGEYKTTVFIKDNGFKLSTKPGSKFTVTTNIVEGETTLQKGDSASNSEKQVCKDSYNDNTKECKPAKVTAFTTSGDKETEKSVTCDGSLNLKTDTCSTGFAYTNCEGDSTKSESNWTCKGSFKNFKCAKGGSPSGCNPTDPTDVSQTCVGYWNGSTCDLSSLIVQLPIIKLNQEPKFIKGACTASITSNSCIGTFSKAQIVTCTGTPQLSQSDYDACKPIAEESFGTCEGTLDGSGCKGVYKHELKIQDRTYNLATASSATYDFTKVTGISTLVGTPLTEQDLTEIQISCLELLDVKTKECTKYTLKTKDPLQSATAIAGNRQLTKSSCEGLFSLTASTCAKGPFVYENCVGNYNEKEGSITCLGDYTRDTCKEKSGADRSCTPADSTDKHLKCVADFWDGQICISEKPPGNSPVTINRLPNTEYKTPEGKTIKVCNFEFDSFTMFGANLIKYDAANNLIDKLKFSKGKEDTNGNLVDLKVSSTQGSISLTEGQLVRADFVNYRLDELDYTQIAVDDTCSFSNIKFKKFTIKDLIVKNFQSTKLTIGEILIGTSPAISNFKAKSLDVSLGQGQVVLRDSTLLLPYISTAQMKTWMDEKTAAPSLNLPVPPENSYLPTFKIVINAGGDLSKKNYIEFPFFKVQNLAQDSLTFDDFLINNKDIEVAPKTTQRHRLSTAHRNNIVQTLFEIESDGQAHY